MGKRLYTDTILFYAVVALVTFGLIMVYSASSIIAVQGKYDVGSNYFSSTNWAGPWSRFSR